MDGGGALSLFSLHAIQRIERELPGFLRSVDVFAGTSAGGINALLMAASATRELGLERSIRLWNENPFQPPLWRVMASVGGCVCESGNRGLWNALQPVLQGLTLGDLADLGNRLVIPALKLKGYGTDGVPTWKPQAFQNLPGASVEERSQLAIDVALRTSASPVFLPIYDGYVDGGLFANNPSMVALARVLGAWREEKSAGPVKIRLLSVGTGLRTSYLDVENADWGWGKWLFDCNRPLALLEVFIASGEEEISEQCRTILGPDFFRLNPPLRLGKELLDFDLEDAYAKRGQGNFVQLRKELAHAAGVGNAAPPDWAVGVLGWLDKVGWCRPGGPGGADRAAEPKREE